MPLKGIQTVKSNYAKVIKEVAGPRTVKVVTAIVATGAAWAKMFTPVDTSALINSQRKSVKRLSGVIVGKVWYAQDYAVYLEDPKNTNPWNPRKKTSAKPHFLKSGFEDSGPDSEIDSIIQNGYKL